MLKYTKHKKNGIQQEKKKEKEEKKPSVLCIGSATIDTFLPFCGGEVVHTPEDLLSQTKILLELGAKYYVDCRVSSVGGGGANVAIGLARRGIQSILCAAIGRDYEGRVVQENLQREGVDTQFIDMQDSVQTSISTVIVEKRSGDRIILANPAVGSMLAVPKKAFSGISWVYIGSVHTPTWKDDMNSIIAQAKIMGVKVAMNPSQKIIAADTPYLLQLLANIDVLILNRDEAREVLWRWEQTHLFSHMLHHRPSSIRRGMGEARYAVKKLQKKKTPEVITLLQNSEIVYLSTFLHEQGVKVVAITDGKDGAYASDGQRVWYTPAVEHETVDTTGAGDAFSAGFLAEIICGKTISQALVVGVANGASVASHYGAVDGLLYR